LSFATFLKAFPYNTRSPISRERREEAEAKRRRYSQLRKRRRRRGRRRWRRRRRGARWRRWGLPLNLL
jgi:hypothetical protein